MRFSRDLDYFHDSEARVAEAFSADQSLLETGGYSILSTPEKCPTPYRTSVGPVGCCRGSLTSPNPTPLPGCQR